MQQVIGAGECAQKRSICHIWPCQRIGVQELKAKFLTGHSSFIFSSYETKFFKMILYCTN